MTKMADCSIPPYKKILIIRLSSMGDVLLTTPIVRTLKQQFPFTEIHYLIKKEHQAVVANNPYISHIHTYNKNISDFETLKKENFDFVVDLQKSTRSKKVLNFLNTPYGTFKKYNVAKWLYVRFKINKLPRNHIVDRYFDAVNSLNVKNDHQGLDYFIPKEDEYNCSNLPAVFKDGFVAVALGSLHQTKRIPLEKVVEISKLLSKPVLLIGGQDVQKLGEEVVSHLTERAYSLCGYLTLNQSASIILQSNCLLTGDTGLMHIGAALRKPMAVLWGNTTPEFGMEPYCSDKELFKNFEISLRCRPCTKLGYKRCPKRHFKCLQLQDAKEIANWINQFE